MTDADGRLADIWLLEILRGTSSRFTFDPAGDYGPIWSPDGTKIVFSSNRAATSVSDLYMKSSNRSGDDQLIYQSDSEKFPVSWSPDGQYIAFENAVPKTRTQIWLLPSAAGLEPRPLLQASAFAQYQAQFSPNGKFIAYGSNESARSEIYVQPFPLTGEKWQVSVNGGAYPIWRKDGKELFYCTADGRIMSVDIKFAGKFDSSVPQQLFQTDIPASEFGAPFVFLSSGQKFLVNVHTQQPNDSAPLTIVVNWQEQLEKK